MAILSVISISCDKTSLGGDGSGNGGNDGPLPELPPLEEVDNVCDKMDDLAFMSYCYENFDVNKDGKVSMVEASAAESIEYPGASSFAGIEYFTNLKNFRSSIVETVDLRYNSMLETIDCEDSYLTKIDLRYNKNISILQSQAFRNCRALTWVALPSSIRNIEKYAFYDCPIKEFLLYAIDVPTFAHSYGSDITFSYLRETAVLKVPAESVEAYKKSSWNDTFKTIEAL